jgi:hypothetical protein
MSSKMMVFMIFILVGIPSLAMANDVSLSGMVRSYTGVRFSEADTAVNEQTLDFNLEGWGDKTHAVVNPYVYINPNAELDMGIREAYLDLFFEDFDLRIGKQVIVWGQAEGAFITDIVSPRNLRSFILADFREIRQGVSSFKADYYAGSFTFEGIWIPVFVPTVFPDSDSMWVRTSSLLSGVTVSDASLPDTSLSNSEWFGKVSYFGSKVNWELMGGYAWTDEPYITGFSSGVATQAYGRYTVLGGSLNTSVGPVAVRSEAAAYLDKPFSALSSSYSLSVEKHDQIQGLVGFDWRLWGVDMSSQYIVSAVMDYEGTLVSQGLEVAEVDQTVTLRLQDTYFSDRLTVRLFGYFSLDSFDALLRPYLSWSLEDGVLLEGGAEIFLGEEDGYFGGYADNSLVYLSLRWYF